MHYGFLYSLLCDAVGCIWSNVWISGYTYRTGESGAAGKKSGAFLEVLEDETVKTPAGRFEDWVTSLELTFDEDESGTILFHNAKGCQRKNSDLSL